MITGGILAGSDGKRFLVEAVRAALRPQVDEIVVVTDYARDDPATGLLRIMEAASHPWVLCLPCDAVQVTATLARDLQDAQWAEEADIVVLHDGARVVPACCLVLRSLAPDLRRYLSQGHSALWRWQSRYRVAHLEFRAPLVDAGAPTAQSLLK